MHMNFQMYNLVCKQTDKTTGINVILLIRPRIQDDTVPGQFPSPSPSLPKAQIFYYRLPFRQTIHSFPLNFKNNCVCDVVPKGILQIMNTIVLLASGTVLLEF